MRATTHGNSCATHAPSATNHANAADGGANSADGHLKTPLPCQNFPAAKKKRPHSFPKTTAVVFQNHRSRFSKPLQSFSKKIGPTHEEAEPI